MTKEKDIALIALFAALIAVLGLIPRIEMVSGVPITAQSLGVMLAGTILGARRGFFAVLLFIGLVALGLPLLSGGRGGLGVFAGPTAGFIIGYPIAAYVTGLVTSQLKSQTAFIAASVGAFIGAIVVLYALGILGLAWRTEMSLGAATAAMLPFIPGDIIKVLITGFVTSTLARLRPEVVFTR